LLPNKTLRLVLPSLPAVSFINANQDFDLRIFSDLLNTGGMLGQKVRPLRSFEPGLPLPLAQLCMEYEYLVKAKLWGNVNGKCLAFCQ
jgi:hypothetical protein